MGFIQINPRVQTWAGDPHKPERTHLLTSLHETAQIVGSEKEAWVLLSQDATSWDFLKSTSF